ncbi:hypothetical protein N9F40_01390 [bacterium]|jgi:hypothetical protein|nr:hypothetical protein [bacterium]|tara:strand:- start:6488 stop:6700 length:213 start_codon:yes stop_codon:yes gene_type:complete
MGGGGQGQSRDDGEVLVPDTTEVDTDANTSGLVGTILASILWVLNFGDGASEEEQHQQQPGGAVLVTSDK